MNVSRVTITRDELHRMSDRQLRELAASNHPLADEATELLLESFCEAEMAEQSQQEVL